MLAYDPTDHLPRPDCGWCGSPMPPGRSPRWRRSRGLGSTRCRRGSGETVHLAQLDNGQVLYVDKRNAARPVDMFSQAGKIGPAYCTGVGKAMLAFLEPGALEAALDRQAFHRFTPATLTDPDALRAELAAIRAAGLSFDREEHEPGIICVAAPILTARGRALGALSITSSVPSATTSTRWRASPPNSPPAPAAIARDAEAWRFPEFPPEPEQGGRAMSGVTSV